jgi:hypothetical protein
MQIRSSMALFRLFILLFLALCLGASPVAAEKNEGIQSVKPPPLTPEGNPEFPARRVGVFWSGLKIADLYTELTPKENNELELKAVIYSYGVAKLISKYKSNSSSLMKRVGGHYQPMHAAINFKMRYGDRRIDMVYDSAGRIVKESNVPEENRAKRKAVGDEMKQGSLDPLTAALEARARVIAIMSGKEKNRQFVLPMYDGRRLSDLKIDVVGLDNGGRPHLTLEESPKAGWTNNELSEKEKRNPIIHIYLDPKDYLPVEASGQSKVGESQGMLSAKCKSLAECGL